MSLTIRFSRETVKELMARLRLAIRQLNRPLIQQISALLLLDDGLDVWSIAARVGVSTLIGVRNAEVELAKSASQWQDEGA